MTTILLLLLLGGALIYLEVFLPGLIAGSIGALCLLTAVVLAYAQEGFHTGSQVLGGVCVALAIGAWCWLKYFPESRIAAKFTSKSVVGELNVAKPELLHATGVASSQLRPSGTATINGKRVDVVTEGSLLESGTPIKVVKVEGARVVVREV